MFNMLHKNIKTWHYILLSAALVSCGGGGGSAGTTSSGTQITTSPAAAQTVITPVTPNGSVIAANTSLSAEIKDSSGRPIPNAVVSFTDAGDNLIITPTTALSNALGVATVSVSPKSPSAGGAGTISFASLVSGVPVSGTMTYSLQKADLQIGSPTFGLNPLSAFGTTNVEVKVFKADGISLVTTSEKILFSSNCTKDTKATLTPSAQTLNGIATATYVDKGCASTDVITAQLEGASTINNSANIVISSPSAASIQFIKADPQIISLQGMGGIQTSTVSFKVLDASNAPLSEKNVNFSLSTAVGGSVICDGSSTTTGKTGSDGIVNVLVKSGTRSTPVRVVATTTNSNNSAVLSTQSDQLTISTGIPDQDSFSLSADVFNIEGLQYEGVKANITVRLGDQYQNAVPDGTVVNFQAENGLIQSTCLTTNSTCTVTLSSQEPRPANGRVTVLAYAIGEETFTDLNGNARADGINELVDLKGVSTDTGEAYLDVNENRSRDANEPYIDFNSSGTFNGPDGKFNGVSCNLSDAVCSTQRSINVFGNIEIVFSGSNAVIEVAPTVIDLGVGGCGGVKDLVITAVDSLGNALPAGTTIEITTTNGKIPDATKKFTVGNSSALGAVPYLTKIDSDGVFTAATATVPAACVDTTLGGTLTVTVTTPKNVVTYKQITVLN